MTNVSPDPPRHKQQRVRLETLEGEAVQLLTAAQHETMKEQVQMAMGDLAAARRWHDEERCGRDGDQMMVDTLLCLADLRLNMVSRELAERGAAAQFFR